MFKSDDEGPLDLGGTETLPRRFGRLTLLRRLARGGMGEVYLAATRGIEGAERPCVVKTIRQEHSTDKSFRARFLDETRIQAQLQHPGVAQILEAATLDDERPYAVVEFVEGRHLGEVQVRSNQLGIRIDWPDVVAIALCFGDALAHIHERTDANGRALDIAHRDLSPQNVMLGYAGDLKLIDFGTARGENRRCRTVSGIVYAKPGYVAPEVANQIPGGAPADLYAFGVMMWELLAGRRFLQGDSVDHQARVAAGELRLPPLAAQLGAPLALDEILARTTEPRVECRTPSARRVVTELAELLKHAPSLADGDRSVRGRIALLMQKLYPAEPARSRADFARRVVHAREAIANESGTEPRPGIPEPSPLPTATRDELEGLLPGTRYRMISCISKGGMGEVWEAQHVDLGRTVALKLMPDHVRGNGGARQRFRAEARAIARLDHPGLVKLHDFGVTAEGRCFFAMEMLQGVTLEARLAEGPMTYKTAVRLVLEAARAIAAAHKAGIVHRDITPSNLFLTDDGNLKVLDFGVAGSLLEPIEETNREAPVVVGTPEYISPEQAAGAPSDARSDVYALGVVLYEAITGRLPHPLGEDGSTTLAALLTAKITVVPQVPSRVVPDAGVPAVLDKIISRTLERDAEKRFQTASELMAELERVLQPVRSRPSRSLVYASAALAFTAVLALGVTVGQSSSAPGVEIVDLDVASALDASEMAAGPSQGAAIRVSAPTAGPTVSSPVAPSSPPVAPAPPSDARSPSASVHASTIQSILLLAQRGQKIAAHHKMKSLVSQHPRDADLLAGLVTTAKGVQAWGEALEAAARCAAVAPSPRIFLELARLQRATSKGDPVATLEKSLQLFPGDASTAALLSEYKGQELARR